MPPISDSGRTFARSAITLALAALALGAAHAARFPAAPPRDPLDYLPGDAPIGVGWTRLLSDDAIEMIGGALRLIEKAEPRQPDEGPSISAIVEFFERVARRPGAIGLIRLTAEGPNPEVGLALVLDAGDDQAAAFAEGFGRLIHAPGRDVSVGGAELREMGVDDFSLIWGAHKEHFVLALGKPAIEAVIDRLNGHGDGLASSDELRAARGKLPAPVGEPRLSAFIDLRRFLRQLKQVIIATDGPPIEHVDSVLAALGLNSVRSGYARVDDGGAGMFLRIDGPRKGLLRLFDQKPLTPADLELIPPDAAYAWVGNLDLKTLWDELLLRVEEIAPEAEPQIRAGLAAAGAFLGFSITDELLPAFGDTWAIFDAASHGGVMLLGNVLVAEVRDPPKLESMLARLIELGSSLSAESEVRLTASDITHRGHVIHAVVVAGLPVPVAACWTIVGDRLIFGLLPSSVAAAAMHVDPKTRRETLVASREVAEALRRFPKEITGFAYVDSRELARQLYPLEMLLATAGVSASGGGAWKSELKTLPERLAGVRNSVGVSAHEPDGVLWAATGDGTAGMLAIGAAAATAIAIPAFAEQRQSARQAVAMSQLRSVGMACLVYANDNKDMLPPALEPLVEAGFLTPQSLRSPEGAEFVLVARPVAMSKLARPGATILAYEEPRDGQRVAAVFADGHVERLSRAEFLRRLRDSYKAFGRDDPIPPHLEAGDVEDDDDDAEDAGGEE